MLPVRVTVQVVASVQSAEDTVGEPKSLPVRWTVTATVAEPDFEVSCVEVAMIVAVPAAVGV
jgi:hypothetical protein